MTIIRVSRMEDEGEAEGVSEMDDQSAVILSSLLAAFWPSVVVYSSLDAAPSRIY